MDMPVEQGQVYSNQDRISRIDEDIAKTRKQIEELGKKEKTTKDIVQTYPLLRKIVLLNEEKQGLQAKRESTEKPLVEMPAVSREVRPPVSDVNDAIFNMLASMNDVFQPESHSSRLRFGIENPYDRAVAAKELFMNKVEKYGPAYAAFQRTRYAKGTDLPFSGLEPWSKVAGPNGEPVDHEKMNMFEGEYYLKLLRRETPYIQNAVFATLAGEDILLPGVLWLDEVYGARTAVLRAKAAQSLELRGYRASLGNFDNAVKFVTNEPFDKSKTQKSDDVFSPESLIHEDTKCRINLPKCGVKIDVFTRPPLGDIESPEGFAARVGIVGNPLLRAIADFTPGNVSREITRQFNR